ncbi:GTP cyclohydrolase [Alginatibacterium sediminis]|uniref:GTP cyclohydrolase n=1 Tax=Alginatibacterium sediminis TaxID=2164068 RepID=A0A420E8R3_9ALTE|nr:YciI family protein [Alginatibacterium sediminis]RKF15781.1 GTP cyclohydrolase [Alginatibacterium sediminis]
MFIISITYKTDLSIVEKHMDAHIAYLESFYASGKFVASGRKVPRTGGIILLNAISANEAEIIYKQDPFFIADVADFEVIEFVPTMTSQDFEQLKACV